VVQVLPKGNAAKAGLKAGDVLLRYNGVQLHTIADLKVVTEGKAPLPLQVWRDGQVQERTIAPGPLGVAIAKESAAAAVRKQRQADSVLVARSGEYEPLPGTRLEVEAVAGLFTKKKLLLGSQASEQRLDELIESGELGEYRILHFATHGEMHPTRSSLCALILARDTLPDPAKQLAEKKKLYDGRLRAEALAKWPLDADLVVLSACETGLGPHGGGDGYLGFSQALFRKGVRSLLLSLWKVDDVATALLMRRFYQNLLSKRAGLSAPLGRAAALAEAQRWLRNLTRQEAEGLAVRLSDGVWRGRVEKLRLAPPQAGQPAPVPRGEDRVFGHPAYWSAFVLLGDPD
jgi:CHAT domain-containing protein